MVITSALHADGPGFNPQWNHKSSFDAKNEKSRRIKVSQLSEEDNDTQRLWVDQPQVTGSGGFKSNHHLTGTHAPNPHLLYTVSRPWCGPSSSFQKFINQTKVDF